MTARKILLAGRPLVTAWESFGLMGSGAAPRPMPPLTPRFAKVRYGLRTGRRPERTPERWLRSSRTATPPRTSFNGAYGEMRHARERMPAKGPSPRWPLQIPPSVATSNSPSGDDRSVWIVALNPLVVQGGLAAAQGYPRRRPLPPVRHGRAPRWITRVLPEALEFGVPGFSWSADG